jgi:hypothetical protein
MILIKLCNQDFILFYDRSYIIIDLKKTIDDLVKQFMKLWAYRFILRHLILRKMGVYLFIMCFICYEKKKQDADKILKDSSK